MISASDMTGAAPPLLIINGAAGSGKSTLARIMCAHLRLPLIDKETIKEALADGLGAITRDDSGRLDGASFSVLFALANRYIDIGMGAAIEAPFYGESVIRLQELVSRSRAATIQCDTDRATLFRRVRLRASVRHSVPFDSDIPRTSEKPWDAADLAAMEPPLLDVPILRIRTTDGYDPTLTEIFTWTKRQLGRHSS
jgi:predicted kinase